MKVVSIVDTRGQSIKAAALSPALCEETEWTEVVTARRARLPGTGAASIIVSARSFTASEARPPLYAERWAGVRCRDLLERGPSRP